jgi:hypothetical protein
VNVGEDIGGGRTEIDLATTADIHVVEVAVDRVGHLSVASIRVGE